jgi:hypothetical protein
MASMVESASSRSPAVRQRDDNAAQIVRSEQRAEKIASERDFFVGALTERRVSGMMRFRHRRHPSQHRHGARMPLRLLAMMVRPGSGETHLAPLSERIWWRLNRKKFGPSS